MGSFGNPIRCKSGQIRMESCNLEFTKLSSKNFSISATEYNENETRNLYFFQHLVKTSSPKWQCDFLNLTFPILDIPHVEFSFFFLCETFTFIFRILRLRVNAWWNQQKVCFYKKCLVLTSAFLLNG